MTRLEDKLQNFKQTTKDGIKRHIFDWIAAIIIVALIAASLDMFGLIDFESIDLAEFLVSWFPYFAAAILLQTDLYKKGVFVGKETAKFKRAIRSYSALANSLSGVQIRGLYEFCEEYNSAAKRAVQTNLLREEGISFEDFDITSTHDSKEHIALKTLDKCTLTSKGYSKRQIAAIFSAKKVKVKGINVNILLSSTDAADVTKIGDDEKTLAIKHSVFSTVRYAFTTLLLSVIAIKNVSDWGWVGVLLTLFKVAYLFAGSYMSYFAGYDDVTVNLLNHFIRKEDILKMYLCYEPEDTEFIDDNDVENSLIDEQ